MYSILLHLTCTQLSMLRYIIQARANKTTGKRFESLDNKGTGGTSKFSCNNPGNISLDFVTHIE